MINVLQDLDNQKPIIKPNSIILGDCIEIMKSIEDKSVDLILTDLPYGEFNKLKWDKQIDLKLLWNEYNRIKKDDTPILLFASGRFKYELYNSNPEMFKYDLVWKKSKAGNPFNAKYMPLKKHEYILVFGNGRVKYNPQLLEGIPYKRDYTLFKKNNMGYGVKGVKMDNKGTRHPDMILEFKQKWRKQDQLHPTQKPVELLQWLIRSYSNEDDVVLDSTMGSASTIIASIKEKRQYIGIELTEETFSIAQKRIKHYSMKNKDYFD